MDIETSAPDEDGGPICAAPGRRFLRSVGYTLPSDRVRLFPSRVDRSTAGTSLDSSPAAPSVQTTRRTQRIRADLRRDKT
jgi:hypothetical protein